MLNSCSEVAGNQLSGHGHRYFGTSLFLMALVWLCLPAWAFSADVSSKTPGAEQVPDGGFESPAVGTPSGYAYRPVGSTWAFVGGSGYSLNNTNFTKFNPNAPEGSQVLFLQGTGRVSQSLDLTEGLYLINLKAAQRGNHNNGGQTFEVRIDGVVKATLTPASSNYVSFSLDLGYLSGGSHSLELRGTNPLGGDNTAFLDDVQLERQTDVPVNGGDMEDPLILVPRGYVYRPTGGSITFSGSSGLTLGGTLFTSGNPAPPQGLQALFIQGTGQANLVVDIPAAAVYRFHFKAALRGNTSNQEQTIEVTTGSNELAEVKVIGTNYNNYITLSIHLSAGNHTLKFKGLNPAGGDNTAFIDDVRLELIPEWSDPYTWDSGSVPGSNDGAIVSGASAVAIAGNQTIHHSIVNGELLAVQNMDFSITTKYIMIMGSGAYLEVGRESTPYPRNATFTLTATSSDPEIMTMGNKFIAAMNFGRMEIHGLPKISWSQLTATANPQDQTITMKQAVDWSIGDSIVLASTDYDPHYAEVRTITNISVTKKILTLNAPLDWMHYGQKETYSSPYRSHELDMRCEVGNLTRNILIQGDAASEIDGFGAHTMVMATAIGNFSNVELFRCGQKSILARYPFHWHLAGDVSGQFIKNCAIHHSFNRVVTVHGSNNAVVEGNVGYDHIGHGYFLENASEMGNYFIRNLGILTRAPQPGEEVELHDLVVENGVKKLPATFWMTNPGNHWIGNVAAGAEGSGFWQVSLPAPLQGTTPQAPYKTPMGTFEDNRAHTNDFSNYAIDGGIDPNTGAFINGHYRPEYSPGNPAIPLIERFTGYRCKVRNIWMRANTMLFEDCSATDGRNMTLFAYNQIMHNSLLVGVSGNSGNPVTQNEINAGRSLPNPNAPFTAGGNRVVGFNVYDGPAEFRKVHFAGFTGGNVYCIMPVGAAQKSTVHKVDSLTFDAGIAEADKVYMSPYQAWKDNIYASGVIDEGGSLTGTNGMRLTPRITPKSNSPVYRIFEEGFNHEPGATYRADWYAWLCPNEHYGLLRLDHYHNSSEGSEIYAIRSDGPAVFDESPGGLNNQNPVIVNGSYRYHWQYHRMPYRADAWLRFVDNGDNVVSVFPNLPSSTRILQNNNQPLSEASSLNALLNSTSQQYYFRDNTLYLKHIGANGGSNAQFGDFFSAISDRIRVCQSANCANAGSKTDYMTLADFEMGNDSRVTVQGNIPVTQESYDSGADPFDATDNKVQWTVNTDGDGVDEYVQLRIQFDRQVWTEFVNMRLNFSGAKVQVYVHDAEDGYTYLGAYDPGTNVVIPMPSQDASTYTKFDNVDWILLRTRESYLGNLNSTHSATLSLYSVLLDDGTSKTSGQNTAAINPDEEDKWSLWPNPNAGSFHLEGFLAKSGEVKLSIYDMTGKLLYQVEEMGQEGNWSRDFLSDETGLSRGMYQLIVNQEGQEPVGLRLMIQ